ncbi:rab GTPase-binding effector protein 1-like isoform X2 [Planococcus citri]|uniref:rab GTPase-binding effector protein 1-like isoform X2 n=1 Tax=Planococcus citri TaxID=170843 RepID=UPI0031F9033E
MDENSINNDGDLSVLECDDNVENLAQQINSLQIAKKKIEEEFGVQRAKMKELYLQKENEFKQQLVDQQSLKSEIKRLQDSLDECRSQMTVLSLECQSKLDAETRKYQDELSSLQLVLKETTEENSKYENDNKQLRYTNMRLNSELHELKTSNSSSGGEIPQILSMPSTVISNLARKVTNQITTQLSSSNDNISTSTATNLANATLSQFSESDSLEDSMRKAQEDAAVLRSLVVPLEEEIKALKDKLREMDAEVRKYQSGNKNVSDDKSNGNVVVDKIIDLDDDTNDDPSSQMKLSSENVFTSLGSNKILEKSKTTSNGSNNAKESLLDSSPVNGKRTFSACEMCSNYEAQLLNAQQKIHDLEKHIVALERYKQELSKETAFRKDMEEKWNEKKEEYKEQVSTLQMKIAKSEELLKELRASFSSTYDDVTQQLKKLCADRENVQRELNRLQMENDNLLGKKSKHSLELQNEKINLPDDIDELREYTLRMKEELISAKIAQETADEMVATLKEEITILRDQSQIDEQNRIEIENRLTENMNKLRNEVHLISQEKNHHKEAYQGVDRDNATLRAEIQHLLAKVDRLTSSKKNLEEQIGELKPRVSSLQNELDNSEKVQKDFVLLSQSLQQELEKIREAENEVRWEHEEDVLECKRCKSNFSVTRKKLHCRHCGRIFCSSCLTHVVNSGPNHRPSKVCDVCHTLLVRDSAPYFSTAPPQCD